VTSPFRTQFGDRELDTITPDEILPFLIDLTKGAKQSTKKLRYANLKAFFNFIRNTFEPTLENPCEAPMLTKNFQSPKESAMGHAGHEVCISKGEHRNHSAQKTPSTRSFLGWKIRGIGSCLN